MAKMNLRQAALLVVVFAFPADNGARGETPPQQPEDSKTDLVSLGFGALKSGDLELLEPLVMNEARYRLLIRQLQMGDAIKPADVPSDEEIRALAKEAEQALTKSSREIRELLRKVQFNLDEARLIAVVVQKPREKGELETKWIRFRQDDPRTRLDIGYLIESEGNVAHIKLNDAYLIGGKRYLARGLYFRAYRVRDDAEESVRRSIPRELQGRLPVIEPEP